jgi:NAD(P)-dependent dehydrogenase (short-subunit alcohol dehydrogenase family)
MRSILVTGANKGVGLAIVEAILTEHTDTFVFLGSRDAERGREAVHGLLRSHPAWRGRLEAVVLDVCSDTSVHDAREHVAGALGGARLYGVVNNAGLGGHAADLATILETNTLGVRRVCEAFLPLLDPAGGRVVNVTSASGPIFVAACSPERQRFFLDASLEWSQLRALVDECLALGNDTKAFGAAGLGSGSPYGLSKACTNTYTLMLARQHPQLRINACTPGYIATDLTLPGGVPAGKTAAELGMKTPAEGARAPMHLLFGELQGNGRYYGSDAKRSPLDRYREPGTPELTGP